MKLLERILLPTDFHGASQSAVEMAVALAQVFDSEITLLHVLPDHPNLKLTMDMLKKVANDQLTAIRKKINSSGVKTADPVIAIGSHFDQIIQLSETQDVNLILMGSGDKESEDKFQLATTTEKVIRESSKPVWVMKRNVPSLIKRIICPVDFSGPSRRALHNAIHLARSFQAELTILTVNERLIDRIMGSRCSGCYGKGIDCRR